MFGGHADVKKFGCATRQTEQLAKVDLEKIFGNRKRVLIIQPPISPVGQNAPWHPAFGNHAGTLQVVHDLGGRDTLIARALPIERSPPALGLH